MLLFSYVVYSQDYKQTQNRVKSIYLYNFLKDIQWEGTSATEVSICLLGKDELFLELEKLTGNRKVQNKGITIKLVKSPSECTTCDLLFVEEGFGGDMPNSGLKCPSLVITSGFFLKDFSTIALLYHENRLQFYVNKELCEANGIKVSSQLFSLANQNIVKQ
ncbi:YfiR family protein [Cytophagales bacterium LB-30]|uniref:YfiR family protein n=1 Tax=Shiella aurantiaca TaxID=3058365 RepID=A0ABT8F3Y7_9BACT|nr:YfiR family protein [Shiella aurantiaca]MDN4165098.1 YfiR family protein [Shiella aurantiaca]